MRTTIDINFSKRRGQIDWTTTKADEGTWTDPMKITKDKSSDGQKWTEVEIP